MCSNSHAQCEIQRGGRWSAAGDLTIISGRSQEVGVVCRFTDIDMDIDIDMVEAKHSVSCVRGSAGQERAVTPP